MRVDGPEPPPPPPAPRFDASQSSVRMFDLDQPAPLAREVLVSSLVRWHYHDEEAAFVVGEAGRQLGAEDIAMCQSRLETIRVVLVGSQWDETPLSTAQRNGISAHYGDSCRVHCAKPVALPDGGMECRITAFDGSGNPQTPDILQLARDGSVAGCLSVAASLERDEVERAFFAENVYHGPPDAEPGAEEGAQPQPQPQPQPSPGGAAAAGEGGVLSPRSQVAAELDRAVEGLPPEIAALVRGEADTAAQPDE